MFVDRSARRIARARRLFVALGVVPLALLAGVAVWARGDGRRSALEARVAAALSLPVRIGTVSDPRPGVMLLEDVVLGDGAGASLRLPEVRVEESSREIRLALTACDCPPRAAPLVAAVARAWLAGDPRYRRDWVVACERLTWGPDGAGSPRDDVRVECVAAEGSRAVRFVARAPAGAADEIRVVRIAAGGTAADRVECEARLAAPVPLAVGAALVAATDGGERWPGATFTGEARLVSDATGWNGTLSGAVDGIDLAELTAGFAASASGTAALSIGSATLSAGRIASARLECRSAAGSISRPLAAAGVDWLGCRPGTALPAGERIAFDAMAWRCRCENGELEISGGLSGNALVEHRGGPLLVAPPGIVPWDRLAWLVSPPGVPVVPASLQTETLLRWLPLTTVGPPSRAVSGRN